MYLDNRVYRAFKLYDVMRELARWNYEGLDAAEFYDEIKDNGDVMVGFEELDNDIEVELYYNLDNETIEARTARKSYKSPMDIETACERLYNQENSAIIEELIF